MDNKPALWYDIGGMTIELQNDLPFDLPVEEAKEFRIEGRKADFVYTLCQVEDMPAFTGRLTLANRAASGDDLFNEKGEYFRGFLYKDSAYDGFYDAVLKLGEEQGTIAYISAEAMANRLNRGFRTTNLLGLELLFLRRGGLFLHSSHLNVNGRALLFSAPSGTGKSTQADLWHEATGAEIINGDRSLLRKKDGVWHAYGCPMCGTSGIHRQGDEPIHAIVMLGQGKENALRRLGAVEAFSLLYPQVTIPKWSRELVLRGMELLDSVISEVPVYHYSCTKTEDAVITLRGALGL